MEKSIIEIIHERPYLREVFLHVIENNNANFAPYHNFNHLLVYTKAIYDGMVALGMEKDPRMPEMLVMGMFHDYNHTAGLHQRMFDDGINISYARIGVDKFFKIKIKNNPEGIWASMSPDFICNVLEATRYPYLITKIDIYQMIARDADLMQNLEPNWIHQTIMGMASEQHKTIKEFIPLSKKFLQEAEFFTDWGKKVKEQHWDRVLSQITLLEEIYQ